MKEGRGLCIRCYRNYGEPLRQKALRLKLYDPSRRPKATRCHILIPIARRPTEEEAEILRRVAEFKVTNCLLPGARPSPKGLRDFLEGQMPPDLLGSLPRSYDIVGDIIVIEALSPAILDYRKKIGEALLKIYPSAKTCLLKVGKVRGEWRIPALEAVAGENRFETTHTEYGVRVRVDLSKAYFSPRLGHERQLVASSVSDGETVVDMFAGVGPFSLAIARRANATIHSIDINPDAIRLLETNLSLNRLKGRVLPHCGDAREIARSLKGIADHVIMNLPHDSMGFIQEATSLLKPKGGILHIYTFSGDPKAADTRERVEQALCKHCGKIRLMALRIVKEVAPKRWQVAIDAFCQARGA